MMNLTTAVLTSGTGIESVMNNTAPMGDRLIYGLQLTATGLLTVFAVLGIIYFVMLLSRAALHREPEKPAQSAPAPAQQTAPLSGPVTRAELSVSAPAAPPVAAAPASDDALIAVLTAAVAAVLADEAAANGTAVPSFRVVSFQRSSRGRCWNGHR